MRFTLTYTGPLPPKQRGVSPIKAGLRAAFAPQLAEVMARQYPDGLEPESPHLVACGDGTGLAVVTAQLKVAAELDVLLLTPSRLGRPGDGDNRLKTLLDGLTLPTAGMAQGEDAELWCLLEDDKLVTRYSLDSRPWLGRTIGLTDSMAVIGVNIVTNGPTTWGGWELTM